MYKTVKPKPDHPTMFIYHIIVLYYWLEVDDRLLDNLLFLSSLASFDLLARSLAYSAASCLAFSPLLRFRDKRWRFRWSLTGVIRRWILGALYRTGLPSFWGRALLMIYCLTSSSLERLYSLRIFPTLLGPSRRGLTSSVRPGISVSPLRTITRLSTLRLLSTMQPWTDLRLLWPVRLGRKQLCPFLRRSLTRPFVRTPCFIGNPCLSFPPLMRTM